MSGGIVKHPNQIVRAYNSKPKAGIIPQSTGKQIAIYSAGVVTKAAANDIGLIRGHAQAKTKVYRDVGGTISELTHDDIAAGVSILATNGDALYVGSFNPISLIGLNVSVASGVGTNAFEYYNGSAWVALDTVENFTDLNNTGTNVVVALSPYDMAKGGDASLDSSLYYLRVRRTSAIAPTAQINEVWSGEFITFRPNVAADNGVAIEAQDSERPLRMDGGEEIIPYFKTSDAKNYVEISYATF